MQTEGKKIIEDWKSHSKTILKLFQQKEYKKVAEPMRYYTKQFIKVLHILNKTDWNEEEDIDVRLHNFKYKPLNIEERIQFVQANPHQYHCYVHLNELYKETEKLYAKAEILEQK